MDSTLMLDAVVGLMTALCVAMLVWGGWLCIERKPKRRPDGQGKAG
jgi:hypothetical protein